MEIIKDKIKALSVVQRDLDQLVIDLLKPYEPEIIDLNIEEQLQRGIDATGQPITPGYRPLTISIKRQKGQPTNRVTLRDEGDFHESFKVRFGPKFFAIYATDEKAEKLERKYGKDIFGLTDQNLQEVIELLRPELEEHIRKKL